MQGNLPNVLNYYLNGSLTVLQLRKSIDGSHKSHQGIRWNSQYPWDLFNKIQAKVPSWAVAMVVGQLTIQSLAIRYDPGSIPVIGIFY